MKRIFWSLSAILLFYGIGAAATIYQTIPTPKITYSDYVGLKVASDETLVDTTILDSGLTRQVSVVGKSNVAVQVQGTWSGTLLFEGSNSDTPTAAPTFVSLYAIEPNDGTVATSTTDNGVFIVSVGGLKTFRVRSETSAWTGKATVKMQTSEGAYRPTTQAVSGTVTVTPSGTQAVSNQALTDAQDTNTGIFIKQKSSEVFEVNDNNSSLTVDNQTLTDGADLNTGIVVRPSTAASWGVTGTFWQSTQPVSLADAQSNDTGIYTRPKSGQTWPVSNQTLTDGADLNTGIVIRPATGAEFTISGTVQADTVIVDSPLGVDIHSMPAITGAVTVSGSVNVDSPLVVDVHTMPTTTVTGAVTVSGTATTTPVAVLSEVCYSDTAKQIKGSAGTVYAILVSGVGVTAGDTVMIKNSTDNSGTSLITIVADAVNGTWAFYPSVGITYTAGIYFDVSITGGDFTATVVYQ